MAKTYEPIATTTLVSSTANTTFSSISGAYTDLILVITGSASPAQNLQLQVGNGSVDTGSNYSATYMVGDGSTANSGRAANQTSALLGAIYANQAINVINIMNYSNTSMYKTCTSKIGASSSASGTYVSVWRSTAAINIVRITSTLDAGTVLTLYGIKAA